MIHIALADDHQLVREGLRLYLSNVPFVEIVAEASNGADLLVQLTHKKVDVVILDLNMPILNGRKTMERILRTYGSTIKIIFIGFNNSLHFVRKYMLLGASALLSKTSAIPVLVEAIECVHDGQLFFESHIPEDLKLEIHQSKGVDYTPIPGEALSPREIDVLHLLCEGYSCPQIAEKLFISKRTVESHKANIFTKFEVTNIAQMMVKAIIYGYYDLPL